MKNVTILLAVVAMAASTAMADDFNPPPWDRDDPFAVTAEWSDFSDVVTDTGLIRFLPDGSLTNLTNVSPGWTTTGVDFWYTNPGDIEVIDGNLHIHQTQWQSINMENIEDDEPLKKLRIQITYTGPAPTIDGMEIYGNTGPYTWSDIEVVDDGHHLFVERLIMPNPAMEIIYFTFMAGSVIEQIVVDTISIPEPATMSLLVIGGIGVLLRRRKK